MSETKHERGIDEFLKIRERGGHLDAEVAEDFVLDIEMDTEAFHIYPRVDPDAVYLLDLDNLDTRGDVSVDSGLELPDYSGPWPRDLRFTDFSEEALVRLLAMNQEFTLLCLEHWAKEVEERFGQDADDV
jgi:hypothetical protein